MEIQSELAQIKRLYDTLEKEFQRTKQRLSQTSEERDQHAANTQNLKS